MNKFFSKKKAAGTVAVLAVVAMLLTGTFAYVLNNQHRDDYLNTEDRIYDLTLLNNFTSYDKTSWNQNETVENPIQVKSMPNTADEKYTNAYVAVQLMEYINVYSRGDWLTVGDVKSSSNTTQALFAIDTNGDYITYAAATAKFGTTNIVSYTQDGRTYALINGSQTTADKNAALGINGKPMRSAKDTFTYGDKKGYDDVKANGASPVPNDRCDSDPIQGWTAVAGKDARDYVSFEFDSNVMKLSDWQAKYAANANDLALSGDFWILGNNGWAYYAQPLEQNHKTAELLKKLKLEKSVSSIDYYMHVDMASASIDQIDVLAGEKADKGAKMPANLVSMFKAQASYNADLAAKKGALDDLIANGTVEAGAKVDAVNGYPAIVDENGYLYVIKENFIDPVLLAAVKTFDINGDNKLNTTELATVNQILIPNSGLKDATGIELLTYLNKLDVVGNGLTKLDVTYNKNLTYLSCYTNQLTELDVTQNKGMTNLYCYSNKLTKLDVSQNPLLVFLRCSNNQITSLDASNKPNMTYLNCSANKLTYLNLKGNVKLDELTAYTNKLIEIDVSDSVVLTSFSCGNNNLTSLDLSSNTKLNSLSCDSNPLTSLNASNCTVLTTLNASFCNLDAIDVSANTKLTTLGVSSNNLSELNISTNTKLNTLTCSANKLTALDVTRCLSLSTLNCSNNKISSLNVSKTTLLKTLGNLNCSKNNMNLLTISTTQQTAGFGTHTNQTNGNPDLVVQVAQ